jgi:ClpP class serine protease
MVAERHKRTFVEGKEDRVLAIDPRAISVEYDGVEQKANQGSLVAIVCIEGPIEQRAGGGFFWSFDGYDSIRARFEAALASEAQAVILKINSPGGDAAGNLECARAMIAAKEASGKPVIAFADEAAYSAAYALACVADEIYLPDTGGVGSVGCLCVVAEMTKAVKKAGINARVIRSGEQKAEGHPLLPLTPDTVARFQERVDTLAQLFAGLVSEQRGMTVNRILGYEGGVFYGKDAVSAGLADGIMSFDDVLEGLESRLDDMAQNVSPKNGTPKEGTMKNLTALYSRLAQAKAGGNGAEIEAVEAEIAKAKSATVEEPDLEESSKSKSEDEEEDDDEAKSEDEEKSEDDDGDDDDDDMKKSKSGPGKKGKYTKKSKSEAVLAAVEELFGDVDPDVLKGRLMALQESGNAAKDQSKRVKALEMQMRKAEVEKLVARGVRKGQIAPAQKDFWLKEGMRSPETLSEYLKTAPSVVRSEPHVPNPDAAVAGGASATEQEICTKLGVSTEKYLKEKARIEREGHFVCTYV